MLQCLSIKSSSATSSIPVSPATINNHACPPLSQGNSCQGSPSPATSTQHSPNINLGSEYSLTVHTNSYNEMWSKIHVPNDSNPYSYDQDQVQVQIEHMNGDEGPHQLHLLSQILHPNRECVEEALQHAKPNNITRLVSAYFDHSENTTNLFLLLRQCIYNARVLYAPLLELREIVPLDDHYITQSHCDRAFEVLLQFDSADNPFPWLDDSHDFQEMQRCFSQLRQQLDNKLRESRSRIRLFRRATTCSALCVIGTAYFPRDFTKKECARVAQLDAAAKGTYVLCNDLNNIDRVVAGLYSAIEGDKQLVRFALEQGSDKYCIHEVLKQLRKNQQKFTTQLEYLEEHVCLGCHSVNRARSLLLDEIRTSKS